MVTTLQVRGPEWDEARKSGIGGSEAAASLGLSPFKTRLRLYKEKRGEIEAEEISSLDYVHFGTMLEPIVRAEYSNRTGTKVVVPRKPYRSRKYPFMVANVDFRPLLSTRVRVIGEAKTVGMFAYFAKEWGEDGSALVPFEYYAQAQHNMVCAGAVECHMPVLIGGQQFKIHRIPRDEPFIAKLVEGEREFWDCVQKGIEPKPTTAEDLLLLFRTHTEGKAVEANRRALNAYRRWLRSDGIEMRHCEIKNAAVLIMKEFMKDAEVLTFNGEKLATWRRTEKDGKLSQRFSGVRPKKEKIGGDDEPAETKRRKVRPSKCAELGLETESGEQKGPVNVVTGERVDPAGDEISTPKMYHGSIEAAEAASNAELSR